MRVTKAQRIILNFIGKTEAPKGYNTLYGNNQKNWPDAITSMTVGQVLQAGRTWTKRFKSSAAGYYQFMNATLEDLVAQGHVELNETFNADVQDRLAVKLLERRGYNEFIRGKIGIVEFARRLAMEWASLPVLANTKGAHRMIKAGQSFYSGDALNKSLVSTKKFNDVLGQVYRAANGQAGNTKTETAIKVGTGAATSVVVVEGAKQINESVTDWQPVIDLMTTVGKYGPAIAGGMILFLGGMWAWNWYLNRDTKQDDEEEPQPTNDEGAEL